MNTRRRVVVTGLGAVTPLGLTFAESWSNLLRGKSGLTRLVEALPDEEHAQISNLACQVAAPVSKYFEHNDSRTTSRATALALAAATDALQGSTFLPVDAERVVGVAIGSGMSCVRDIVLAQQTQRVSPYFVPKLLTNSPAGRIAVEWQCRGPNLAPSTACAASAHAIGDAFRYIQAGMADVMIAGGTEACLDPLSLMGFAKLRALSTHFNHDPPAASRPMDAQRDGFVMAEGAACLILEALEVALERKAPILAEICGYGASNDAHHATAPHPQGLGAEAAMNMAWKECLCQYGDADLHYVNAHATSTPLGDDIEAAAIARLFPDTLVSSTKGATGHLLGAAGALEAAFCIQAMVEGVVPHTLNLCDPVDVPLQFVMDQPLPFPLQYSMSNSFGFGGTNASLVFRKFDGELGSRACGRKS